MSVQKNIHGRCAEWDNADERLPLKLAWRERRGLGLLPASSADCNRILERPAPERPRSGVLSSLLLTALWVLENRGEESGDVSAEGAVVFGVMVRSVHGEGLFREEDMEI